MILLCSFWCTRVHKANIFSGIFRLNQMGGNWGWNVAGSRSQASFSEVFFKVQIEIIILINSLIVSEKAHPVGDHIITA
jgi:hypothetical protein